MARSSSSKPVEIVYYPKKARGPCARVVSRSRRWSSRHGREADRRPSRKGRRTLTDETVDPAEQAFADLTRLGHEAFEAGRADEARVVFESLVALGRRDPFAHTMLGTILLGRAARSTRRWSSSRPRSTIDPDDLAALVYRGEIRLSRRKMARAIEDLERAVKLGAGSDPFVARARKLLTLARANRTP